MKSTLDAFRDLVALRYQIYNSIFLTLNLGGVHQTGIWLPLLAETCEEGFRKGKAPDEIIKTFFEEHREFDTDEKQIDQLFRFVQYIERQVVLVDALEDAAFNKVNDRGSGSFASLHQRASNKNAIGKLREALEKFRVRIVLTAHPTQFYPGAVLGIISDLDVAIRDNKLGDIKRYLEQLGKTPFFKKEKPTPLDEAISLIWYLENIFYESIPGIYEEIFNTLGEDVAADIIKDNPLMQLGFWPGGDRDGNPFVSTDTTLEVADRLRVSLLKSYYRDSRKLKRRITFRGTEEVVNEIQEKLYRAAYTDTQNPPITLDWLKNKLIELERILHEEHNGLFSEEVRSLIHKVKIFGFHFSTLDIRQDSRVIKSTVDAVCAKHPELFPTNFAELSEEEKVDALFEVKGEVDPKDFDDAIVKDTIGSFYAIREVKRKNGEYGAYRYIISNCRGGLDMAHVFALARLSGWEGDMHLDIIPLFETIDDLRNAGEVMGKLYKHPVYQKHLDVRKNKQVVMLGFSDGTKDGGYLTANWGIYQAKEDITKISRENDISVIFFDGRGGPPARGGGNTHKFYASLGNAIESNQIQLTIQGQTISSNFGTVDSSRFNMEQLLSAGLENQVLNDPDKTLEEDSRKLIDELSEISYKTYQDFKSHPRFVPYLERMSTLKYYGQTNIGSRPSKRGKSDELRFEDLRAIPFVGAWSQLKQNVPGFFGLGTTFEKFDKEGRLHEVKELYKRSLFFRTLLENSMQSLSKSYFPLTEWMHQDPEFGEFWEWIHEESKRAKKYLLEISGQNKLLETSPQIRESIKLRERIVLPLLTIQQHALIQIRKLEAEGKGDSESAENYRKLVVRSLYGNINASRNSA